MLATEWHRYHRALQPVTKALIIFCLINHVESQFSMAGSTGVRRLPPHVLAELANQVGTVAQGGASMDHGGHMCVTVPTFTMHDAYIYILLALTAYDILPVFAAHSITQSECQATTVSTCPSPDARCPLSRSPAREPSPA